MTCFARVLRVGGIGVVLACLHVTPLRAQDAEPAAEAPPAEGAGTASAAQPTPEEAEAYEHAIRSAVSEFAAGRWDEARALFKRAHEIEPNARTLRGLGMTAFELRMYVVALRELDAALRDERKPLTESQRKAAEALVERANAFVGRYQLVLEPAHARPFLDGQPVQFEPGAVVLVNIGEHELRVSADGYRTQTRRLRVEGGQRAVLSVTLEAEATAAKAAPTPPAEPSAPAEPSEPPARGGGGLQTAAWISLGGAAVLGGAAAVFWVIGSGQYDDLDTLCGQSGCSDAQIDDSGVKTSDLMTNVFIGLAAAAGVTSVVLFVIDAGDEEAPASARTELRLGPGTVQLKGRL